MPALPVEEIGAGQPEDGAEEDFPSVTSSRWGHDISK